MSEFELKIRRRDLDSLIELILSYNPQADIDLLRSCYIYAEEAHQGQTRLSGEPYIIHPLEVGIILASLKMDTITICAALMHDVVEDTGTTLEIIRERFGEEMAILIDGVTKISYIKNKSRASAQADTLRKMLMATVRDIRVIIIKLADKTHNMRTIMFQPIEKQYRIAREVLDIYAPIARRLGMTRISSDLEDMAFHVIYKEEYDYIRELLAQKEPEREQYLKKIRETVTSRLSEIGLEAEISGRAKHYFSIFRKMKLNNKDFDEIYDLRAIRIITHEVRDCYAVLGVIHTLWTPLAGRFKDYIAVPKTNMYQSLHTTVIGPEGHPLEVQIRTREMHETAIMGIASHWLYKENRKPSAGDYRDLEFFRNINKLYESSNDSREFLNDLKMDLYEDEIFVFTPKGKIIRLGKGATPVDFAFAIHSEVGFHTSGARVNNKIVPLRTRLNSGDIVEVLTSKTGHPSASWLKYVKSSGARYKIRAWLRKNRSKDDEAAQKSGESKKRKEAPTAAVKIPEEEQIKIRRVSNGSQSAISVDGDKNVLIRLPQCCQPIPGDDVIGFITRGRGITVHKRSCPSLKRLEREKERFIKVVWEKSDKAAYPVKIAVEGVDRPNLLKDVADEISLCSTNILKAEAEAKPGGNALFKFTLQVKSNEHFGEIASKIRQIKNITNVYKLNEKVTLK